MAMKRLVFAVVASFSLCSLIEAAILTHFKVGPGALGNNAASDENRDYLIDRNWNGIPVGMAGSNAGSIDVGDSLRAAFNINTLNSAGANIGGTTGENEWTGISQIVVTSKTAGGLGSFIYTFAPDPLFLEGLGTIGGGPAIVFYEGSGLTLNFTADWDDPAPAIPGLMPPVDDGTIGASGPGVAPPNPTDVSTGAVVTEEAFITTATDGTRFWTLGFTGAAAAIPGLPAAHPLFGVPVVGPAAGEGWLASTAPLSGFDNILAAFGVTTGTTGASANVAVNRLDGPGIETGDVVVFGPTTSPFGGTVDVAGSGTIRGVADLETPFEASSDVNFAFNVQQVIPEPAAVVVWSVLGALGVVLSRRSRRTK
jgi:hypothetical protein